MDTCPPQSVGGMARNTIGYPLSGDEIPSHRMTSPTHPRNFPFFGNPDEAILRIHGRLILNPRISSVTVLTEDTCPGMKGILVFYDRFVIDIEMALDTRILRWRT